MNRNIKSCPILQQLTAYVFCAWLKIKSSVWKASSDMFTQYWGEKVQFPTSHVCRVHVLDFIFLIHHYKLEFTFYICQLLTIGLPQYRSERNSFTTEDPNNIWQKVRRPQKSEPDYIRDFFIWPNLRLVFLFNALVAISWQREEEEEEVKEEEEEKKEEEKEEEKEEVEWGEGRHDWGRASNQLQSKQLLPCRSSNQHPFLLPHKLTPSKKNIRKPCLIIIKEGSAHQILPEILRCQCWTPSSTLGGRLCYF